MSNSIIEDKSFKFAIKIINTYKALCEKNEFVMSKQLLRTGTSIGANVKEALRGQSKKDFLSKMNISLKEANEVEYWIELLFATNYLDKNTNLDLLMDCKEICRILNTIVKSTRESLELNN
ncbi:four helix bundle protein [Tissierella carlieri]|uniref:four helix bundle protein n=1 Tax=Tissierella carlieri TaxID=689904 RepID=UPI001C0F9CF3|nr:four helix bundle protein [Tissierella carlieri]MBU5313144.1 four helix bundle protein [Tissierella carlieri]